MDDNDIDELTKTKVEPFEKNDVVVVEEKSVVKVKENNVISDDFDYTRGNLYNVIEKGSHALEELIEFAKSSQSPRAFEVVSKLIDTITNSNDKLFDIHQKVKKLGESKTEVNNSQTVGTMNNIVFNGTTEQLFDIIEEKIKDKK
jgi:hypothetical protein